MNLLINALQVETDPQNTHMLLGKNTKKYVILNVELICNIYIFIYLFILPLGGLLLSVQDSAAAEEVEQVTQPDAVPNDTTVNLLSSGLFKKRNKKETTPKKKKKEDVGLKI